MFTEYAPPFYRRWYNVKAGEYTITAKATDTYGRSTFSTAITVTVKAPGGPLVSNRPSDPGIKDGVNNSSGITLAPNPVRNILNINTTGLQKYKLATISIISASGVILQTKQLNNLTPTIQLNVSSLASGTYIIKIMTGNTIMYRHFIKM